MIVIYTEVDGSNGTYLVVSVAVAFYVAVAGAVAAGVIIFFVLLMRFL